MTGTTPDASGRQGRLRRNITLLYWKNFFQNGLFINPVWSVFLLSRGVAKSGCAKRQN